MGLTIGVDVGGTKVAGGVVDEHGKVLTKIKRPTPVRSAERVQQVIVDVIRELTAEHQVEAVGVGAPGFVDEKRSTVLMAPNVVGWRNVALRALVEQAVGLPVVVENDANAAAWGESEYGAGRGEDYLVLVTVGTGIGGGIIIGGELYRGRFGVGAEIGHMQVEAEGRPCGCGQRGCWEQYASGNALLREARWGAAEHREDAGLLLEMGEGTPEGITGVEVTEAARRGDKVALGAFEWVGQRLGQGLADLAAILDPGRFVIGGGVSEAGDLLLLPARKAFAAKLTAGAHRPHADVRIAELGNEAGLIGAADLARLP